MAEPCVNSVGLVDSPATEIAGIMNASRSFPNDPTGVSMRAMMTLQSPVCSLIFKFKSGATFASSRWMGSARSMHKILTYGDGAAKLS